MQVLHQPSGMPFEFPDDTPPEAIQGYFRSAEQGMPTTAPTIAQQFIDGARGAYEQQQLAPAPVNGRGFVGLDPQQAQFMLQQRQNAAALQQRSASEQARNRLQEQQMVQQSVEAEKDRALRINEFQSRLKNEQKLSKAREDFEKWKMEQEAKGREDFRKTDFDFDAKLEELRAGYRQEDIAARTAGQKEVVQMRAQSQGNEPRRLVRTVETRAINPDTGKEENVLKEYYSDGTSDFIPAPAGGTTSKSDYKGLGVPVEYFDKKVGDYTKLLLDEQESRVVGPEDPGYISPAKAREIAKKEAEAELAEAAGYEVWRAPDGTPYWAETE